MSNEPIITRTVVTYSQSRKINMGNYEAVDIFASCTFESVEAGSEEVLYAKAADAVEKQLGLETEELQKQSLNSVTKKKTKTEKVEEVAEEKPKKKKEKKPKKEEPVEEKEADEEGLDLDAVREALRAYSKEHGKPAAKAIIKDVAGCSKMDDIPEDKFSAVIVACEEAPEEGEDD